MRRIRYSLGFTLAIAVLLAVAWYGPASVAEEEVAADGQAIFETAKCNMCHGVPSVGIEAKVTSEKMKGPDIDGLDVDADLLAKYLRKAADLDGKSHKKEFKGSDEELQALVDWLLAQKS